jgi:hypothetical protein
MKVAAITEQEFTQLHNLVSDISGINLCQAKKPLFSDRLARIREKGTVL